MSKTKILQLISLIDLTTLEATDTNETVKNLLDKANLGVAGVHPAAVCVFPNFGALAKKHAQMKVAVVGGCFPTGQTLLEAKTDEFKAIQKLPVDEVDIVINRGLLIAGKVDACAEEIKIARKILHDKTLKVILESGELTAEQLQTAAEISIHAGADFIKTSTGKSASGASPEAAKIMCREISKHFKKTGKKVGFKASGGIRNYEDACLYFQIVEQCLGKAWLNAELFRIGASSLYDHLVKKLQHT
ncbi:MAG: deoxyribose-phosphate aldolase [Crocinitomicaceae bacterium]